MSSGRRPDRGRCAVHKLRNVVAKLPKRPGLRDEIKDKYWAALDDATDPADAEKRLRELVAELGAAIPERSGLPGRGPVGAVHPPEPLPTAAQAVPVLDSAGAV